jgi:hypothetical protein
MAGNSDTILARLKVIGGARFRKDIDDSGDATTRMGEKARRSGGGLRALEKQSASLTGGLKVLAIVAGIVAGVQGMGLIVQGAGAGIVALGALGVAALGAGVVLGAFAAGAAARFKQMADVGGSAANDLKTRFGEFKTLLSDELGPAFDPVFKALAGGLEPLGNLVRAIAPAFKVLGNAVADGVTQAAGLLEGFGPGISQLLIGVSQLIGPMVDLFGNLVGVLLVVANAAMPYLQAGIEKLSYWLSGLSSDQITGAVTGAFQTLGTVFKTVAGVVGLVWPVLMSLAAGLKQIADGALPGVVSGIKSLTPAFQAIVESGALQTLAAAVGDTFAVIARVVGTVVTELQRFGLLKPILVGLTAAFVAWKIAIIATNIALRANPVVLLITAIAALVVGLIYAYRRFEGFRNVVNTAWSILKSVFGWISRNWKLVLSILTGPIGAAVIFIASNFGKIKNAAVSVVNRVKSIFSGLVGFLKSLPGKVGGAVSGMWNGIKEGFRGALNWIIGKWNGLEFTVPEVDLGPLGKIGGGTIGVPDIPYLAQGGTVRGQGSFITGEAGPELNTILPGGNVRVQPLTGGNALAPTPAAAPAQMGRRDRQPLVVQLQVGKRQLAEVMADIELDLDAGIAV